MHYVDCGLVGLEFGLGSYLVDGISEALRVLLVPHADVLVLLPQVLGLGAPECI
jgi:hypothetical protein